MRLFAFLCAALCALVCAAAETEPSFPPAGAPSAFAEDASAADVLAVCRAMLPPRPVRLEGRIVRRNRRGTVQAEYAYALEMHRNEKPSRLMVDVMSKDGGTNLLKAVILRDGAAAPKMRLADVASGKTTSPSLDDSVLGTDVTWLDLTLDFLWWPSAEFEAERDGETVHGQKCRVIVVRPGAALGKVGGVRLWADRRTGCMMQAEQLDADGRTLHRLWGTRIKKFGDRWSVSVVETESPGVGLRTKITVESLGDPAPGAPAAP